MGKEWGRTTENETMVESGRDRIEEEKDKNEGSGGREGREGERGKGMQMKGRRKGGKCCEERESAWWHCASGYIFPLPGVGNGAWEGGGLSVLNYN